MIKLLVMDVDGTLTDGGVYYDDKGNEFKKFSIKDGAGIVRLHNAGISTMILTGRNSECVKRRFTELKVDYIVQGIAQKAEYLEKFMQEHSLKRSEVAYIGDDINDLECMELVENTACPCDAVEEVKEKVQYICQKAGGQGAVREYADKLLKEKEEDKIKNSEMSLLEDEDGAWYTQNRLRAHAGGGIDGFAYTNSYEALINTYNRGIKVIEFDATITSDDKAVISHNFMPDVTKGLSCEVPTYDEFMQCKICDRFTPMSLEQLMEFMEQHDDLYVVLDHPAKGSIQLARIIIALLKILEEKKISKKILDQFIIQVFSVEEYEWMRSVRLFKNIEFYFSASRDIEGTLEYVVKNKVHTVSINKVRLNKEIVGKFNRWGVRVFSPSINEENEVKEAFEMGLWGVTSDFLDQRKLQEIIVKEQ